MQAVGRDTESAGRDPRTDQLRSRPSGRAAIARFQLASVRLAAAGTKDAHAWTLDALGEVPATARELEAGRALLGIAEAGDAEVLRQLLRADPTCAESSWTVACYRVGDLSPHNLRDFTDPVAAVRTLVDCGDEEHLAAELVASTPDGLCWVALVRTGDQVRFQLFGPHSVLARPGRHGPTDGDRDAIETAQAGWAAVLASWYTAQGAAGPFLEARLARRSPTLAVGAAPRAGVLRELLTDGLVFPGGDLVGAAAPHAAAPWDVGDRTSAAEGTATSLGVEWAGGDSSPSEMFFTVAATVSDLARSVADIAEVVERLDRSVGALVHRVDALAMPAASRAASSAHVQTGAAADGEAAVREPARRWWEVWRRATRRSPAVGGAAARPL